MITILDIHPADSAFIGGKLLMPLEGAAQASAGVAAWSDNLLNSSLVVLFVILALLNLANLIGVLPAMLDCLGRWKAHVTVDSSLKVANARNSVAFTMVIPVCLLASRYNLLQLDFCQAWPPAMKTLVVFGVALLFILLRKMLFNICTLRTRRRETALAGHHATFNCFIPMSLVMFAAVGVCLLLRSPDESVRLVLYVIAGLFYLVALLRKSQIFNSFCNPFATFLYLCALEFVPVGAVIAAGVML